MEELAGEKLNISQDEKTGFLKCDFESTLQEKSNFLMDSMTFSLENISREYGRCVDLINLNLSVCLSVTVFLMVTSAGNTDESIGK